MRCGGALPPPQSLSASASASASSPRYNCAKEKLFAFCSFAFRFVYFASSFLIILLFSFLYYFLVFCTIFVFRRRRLNSPQLGKFLFAPVACLFLLAQLFVHFFFRNLSRGQRPRYDPAQSCSSKVKSGKTKVKPLI